MGTVFNLIGFGREQEHFIFQIIRKIFTLHLYTKLLLILCKEVNETFHEGKIMKISVSVSFLFFDSMDDI